MAAWWHRFLRVREPDRPVRAGSALPAAAPAPAPPDQAPEAAPPPLLPWLLAVEADADRPLASLHERRALRVVDALLQRPEPPLDWLPRARSVIPQLLALLRRPDLALPALAELVARDLLLTAEVMRSAAAVARAGSPSWSQR